jgi:hypothetical protein
MRLAADGPAAAQIMMTDQSPASVLAIRVPSGGALDSVLSLLESRVTVALRASQPAATPDLLDCEAAGDWRFCLVIATARAAASSSERLDALSTYVRGSRTPLPLWP